MKVGPFPAGLQEGVERETVPARPWSAGHPPDGTHAAPGCRRHPARPSPWQRHSASGSTAGTGPESGRHRKRGSSGCPRNPGRRCGGRPTCPSSWRRPQGRCQPRRPCRRQSQGRVQARATESGSGEPPRRRDRGDEASAAWSWKSGERSPGEASTILAGERSWPGRGSRGLVGHCLTTLPAGHAPIEVAEDAGYPLPASARLSPPVNAAGQILRATPKTLMSGSVTPAAMGQPLRRAVALRHRSSLGRAAAAPRPKHSAETRPAAERTTIPVQAAGQQDQQQDEDGEGPPVVVAVCSCPSISPNL